MTIYAVSEVWETPTQIPVIQGKSLFSMVAECEELDDSVLKVTIGELRYLLNGRAFITQGIVNVINCVPREPLEFAALASERSVEYNDFVAKFGIQSLETTVARYAARSRQENIAMVSKEIEDEPSLQTEVP